jgi:pimeloyl-ACP methyl ester carboxylesterase
MQLLLKGAFVLVGLALLVLAGFVAIAWAPDRPVDELKGRWAAPPSTFIEVSGLQVHMRDEGPRGDPAPIVLLHGTSSSLHTWDGWVAGAGDVAGLKESRRVIRLDLPGFGLTGPFRDHDYRVEHYAEFVHAFLDRLGVSRCVLVGNSLGGQIAMVTLLARPARVDRLILIDSAGYPLAPAAIPIGFQIARLPVFNLIARITLPRAIVEDSVRNVYGDAARVTPELVDRYFELTLREGNRHALAKRLKLAAVDAITARIPEIRVPTLILWGDRDRLIPAESGRRFATDIAGSRLQTFAELGHVPHEEDPARTLPAARLFLELPK